MQSPAISTKDDLMAICKRLRHLSTLPAAAREKLQQDHAQYKDSAWQTEPEEYQYLAQCPYPLMEHYRALRRFYDQLVYASNESHRHFTFQDAANHSSYGLPTISVFDKSVANSFELIRDVRTQGKMPQEYECEVFYGVWRIVTSDAAMVDALVQMPAPSKDRYELDGHQNFVLWHLTPEAFDRIVQLILQYQGDSLLPFRGESYLQSVPTLAVPDAIGQIREIKDAWL